MSFPEPPASESLPSPPERVDGVEVVFVMLSAPSPPLTVIPMIPAAGHTPAPAKSVQAGWAAIVAPGSTSV